MTGSATPTRGAGRPAASAAAVMVGTTCEPTVAVPVIQVTVPEAVVPAISSIFGPRAATRTGGGGPATESGA